VRHDLHDAPATVSREPSRAAVSDANETQLIGPAAGLHDTLEAGAMRLEGGPADRIDDGIHVVALPQRGRAPGKAWQISVQKRAEDELAPASGPHGANEIGVLPGVGAGSIDGGSSFEQLPEWGKRSACLAPI